MDVETITKLLDAGYTKAEIEALGANAGTSEGAENLTGDEDAGAEQSNASAENAGAVNPEIVALTKTVNELTATVKAIQENNVRGAATTSPSTGDKINDAMKSFIEKL